VRDGLRIGRIHNPGLADALGAPPSDPLWCRRYRLAVEQVMTASIFEVFSPRLED
jgi:chorismate-pyruvate lyase